MLHKATSYFSFSIYCTNNTEHINCVGTIQLEQVVHEVTTGL